MIFNRICSKKNKFFNKVAEQSRNSRRKITHSSTDDFFLDVYSVKITEVSKIVGEQSLDSRPAVTRTSSYRRLMFQSKSNTIKTAAELSLNSRRTVTRSSPDMTFKRISLTRKNIIPFQYAQYIITI